MSFMMLAASSQGIAVTSQPAVAPMAAKRPYQVASPNGAREDDYYWLRDDTRQSKDVLEYLNVQLLELRYFDALLDRQLAESFGLMAIALTPLFCSTPISTRFYSRRLGQSATE